MLRFAASCAVLVLATAVAEAAAGDLRVYACDWAVPGDMPALIDAVLLIDDDAAQSRRVASVSEEVPTTKPAKDHSFRVVAVGTCLVVRGSDEQHDEVSHLLGELKTHAIPHGIFAGPSPPGPVASTQKPFKDFEAIQRGMRLQAEQGGVWWAAEVLEVLPNGDVKIHYIGWAEVEVVPRSRLEHAPK